MKNRMFKYAAGLLSAVIMLGCQQNFEEFDNKLFIDGTSFVDKILVNPTEALEQTRQFTVSIPKPEAKDVEVKFAINTELLEHYRQAYYSPEVLLFPVENAEFVDSNTTLIQEGSVTSTPFEMNFTKLDVLDPLESYVLPIEIESVDGVDILESASRYYFVFEGVSLINVVPETTGTYLAPTWADTTPVTALASWTMEAMVYPYELNKLISSIMGVEGYLLIRIGDADIPANQIQLATSSGNVTSSVLALELNAWQHVAVSYDGTTVRFFINGDEVYAQDIVLAPADLGRDDFYIGRSWDDSRDLIGRMSEVRIWNKALTSVDIKNGTHVYGVDYASEGLVAYWKMNEGQGTFVKDYTSYGNNMNFSAIPTWVNVSLPEE